MAQKKPDKEGFLYNGKYITWQEYEKLKQEYQSKYGEGALPPVEAFKGKGGGRSPQSFMDKGYENDMNILDAYDQGVIPSETLRDRLGYLGQMTRPFNLSEENELAGLRERLGMSKPPNAGTIARPMTRDSFIPTQPMRESRVGRMQDANSSGSYIDPVTGKIIRF